MAEYEKEPAKGKDKKGGLEETRRYLKECVEAESIERSKMKDDLRFAALDQWPDDLRKEREDPEQEGGPRPCLTIDKLNQYLVQVVNDVRQGKPGINVRPQDDRADIETAKVLKGLIRNIEDQSNADIAYATAVESAAKVGLGYFRIMTEYVSPDSFDQEIFIRPIPNTFSVYLGKHLMPDGSDAERGYIVEQMAKEKFRAQFPDAKAEPKDFDELDTETRTWWYPDEESVIVVEEYCIKHTRLELLFLEDGTTIPAEDYRKISGPKPAVQDSRWTTQKQLKWKKCTAVEELDSRDLPGQYIPIVEVVGREAWVDGKRVLWGLVRPAKDSLRMYNYWASTITERMALAPKQPYIGAQGQFEGLEQRWRDANRKNRAYLEYKMMDVNGNAVPAPKREGPVPMEAALLQQMQVIEHDVQTSLGMFKAAVGETESQQSGRAILALQRESDTGTYHFGANLGVSIRHAGRIIVDMIPHYYDTKRIVRILGEDGEVQTATLDPALEQSYAKGPMGAIFNPNVGKYDVSISVGPSYNTKRMEALATYVEMAKGAADPASAATLRYLVMRNSDSAGSDEAAKLLKSLLPPQVLQSMDSGAEPVPPRAQAQIQQLQQVSQQLKVENDDLKSGAREAQMKVQVQAQEGQAKLQVSAQESQAKLAADREAAAQKIALERAIAQEKAALAREIAEADAQLKREIAASEQQVQMKKVEFEREKAIASDPNFKDLSMMPKVDGALGELKGALGEIGQALQQLAALTQQTLAVQQESLAWAKKTKVVGVSGVQTNGGGDISGATVTVQ